jgi:hypothetical protein
MFKFIGRDPRDANKVYAALGSLFGWFSAMVGYYNTGFKYIIVDIKVPTNNTLY